MSEKKMISNWKRDGKQRLDRGLPPQILADYRRDHSRPVIRRTKHIVARKRAA